MNSSNFRLGPAGLLIAVALLGAGCVQETRSGDSMKYTYELWVPLSILGAGLAALLLGCVLWTFQNRYKWALIVIGVIGVLLGPSMFFDHATVDPQGLSIRTGIPYFAATESVKFDDVQQVRQTKRVSRGRRGRKTTNYYYEFDLKSGTTVAVSVSGNDLRRRARIQIVQQLSARNINVVDDLEL